MTTRTAGGDGATNQAQEKAQEVASQAQDKAREAAGQARGRMRDQVDQRSTELGDRVNSSASDARSVAEQLRNQGKDAPARYVEQAADRAERVGGYLRDSDGDRILGDVEDFARGNTWAVALGGLALGFAASRMLKASSSNRYRSSLDRYDTDYATHPRPGASAGRFEREYGEYETGVTPAPGLVSEPPASSVPPPSSVPPRT